MESEDGRIEETPGTTDSQYAPGQPVASAETLQAMGNYLRELAHEISNSVHLLRLIRQILEMQPGDATTMAEVREILDQQLAPWTHQIEGIRRAGQALAGFQPRRVPLDASTLARDTLESLAEQCEGHGVRPQIRVADPTPEIQADGVLLQQAIAEMVTNACRYAPGPITVSVQQNQSEVHIQVEDAGPGVPPEIRSRVFEPFVRGAGPPDVQSGELGLGLALVRNIARAHGGRVELQQAGSATGSRFVLALTMSEKIPNNSG